MSLVTGPDGLVRCAWGSSPDIYVEYHDTEWGFPVADDTRLFEKLCLESFQSGLSWLTILRKRPAFRQAFFGFEIPTVAAMGAEDVDRLLEDSGIVRHRGKIESAINNARRTLEVIDEHGSLASLVWQFEPDAPAPAAAQTPESQSLSKTLRNRGFTWVGPTTAYAFMQSMGLVNDHLDGCHIRSVVEENRAGFLRP